MLLGESYTKTPITSDKALVIDVLNKVSYDGVINDGTAIGMGLGLFGILFIDRELFLETTPINLFVTFIMLFVNQPQMDKGVALASASNTTSCTY